MSFILKAGNTHYNSCSTTWCFLAVWILAVSGRVAAQSEPEIQITRMEASGSYRVDSGAILKKEAAGQSEIKPQMRSGRRIVPVLDLKQRKLIRMDTLPEPARMRPEPRVTAETTARTWTTVMTEDFEGEWPSAGWARGGDKHSNGAEITWAPWAYHPASGMKSCFAQGTVVDPSSQYTIKATWGEFIVSDMWYGPINLEGVTDARIIFKLSYELGKYMDIIGWAAFSASDTSSVLYVTGYPGGDVTNWPDYDTYTYNFNTDPYYGSLCGLRDVYFLFTYLADDYQDYNKAAFVDDVRLEISMDPLPQLSLDISEWSVPSVGGTSETVHVTSSDETLGYTVSDDAFWLTLSESGGTTPGGFTMTTDANQTGLTRKAKVTVTAAPHEAASASPAILNVTQISTSDSGWTTLMTEDFEGEWPSEGWTLDSNTLDEDGGPITWDSEKFFNAWGTRSAHPHGSSIDPRVDYSVTAASGTTITSSMRYGPFSLPEYCDARFRFRMTYQLAKGDTLRWGVSAGDPDTAAIFLVGLTRVNCFPQWWVDTFDLTRVPFYGNLCGRSDVYIHFLYIADDIQDRNEAAYIDDIYLQVRPFKDRLILDAGEWEAPPAGGVSGAIHVNSTGEAFQYGVQANTGWLRVSYPWWGMTPGEFFLSAFANNTGSARTAEVRVWATMPEGIAGSPATIMVTQGPILPPRMSLSDSTWSAPPAGGKSDTMHVSSSGGTVLYTVSDGADWLTLSDFNGTTPGGFTLTAAANDADSARTAAVTVRAVIPAEAAGSPATITVTQPKAPVPASIGPIAPSVVMPGEEFQVDIHIGDPVAVNDLFNIRFDLTFSNTSYVDYAAAEPGPFFGTDAELLPVSDDAAGKVSVAISRKLSSGGVSGAGVAVCIRFRTLQDAPENARVDFTLSGITAEDEAGNPVSFTASGNAATVMTHVGDGGDAASNPIPAAFELFQNFPNPFNPVTEIRFGLPHAGEAELTVFDGSGRVVAILFEGFRQAGYHSLMFDASKLPSGSYTCRLQAGSRVLTRKMVLVK